MAESNQVGAHLATLENGQKTTLQKLIALEKLSESCEHGFSTDELELIFSRLPTIKASTSHRARLVECCLPSGDVSRRTIDIAVFLMSRPHTELTLKRSLLIWLTVGVQHFFTPDTRKYLRTYYCQIFLQIEYKALVNMACTLLLSLTELSDVQEHRVNTALELAANTGLASDSGPLWSLISKYRLLRPGMVQQRHVSAGGHRSYLSRSRLVANVERWRQRRDETPAGDSATDLWHMGREKVSRRAAALPVLPESVPASGGGEPDRQQGCRELTSLGSLEEVAKLAALGFREANNVTSLLLTSERRALLLLSDNLELDITKVNTDLAVSLRTMFLYQPRHYTSQQRRELARQLQLAQHVGLPLSAGRDLMRRLLARAHRDRPEHWLPALDLLPFYGWRPHEVLREELLKPLQELVAPADRHVRLHVVHVLTEFVLRLARDELPRVRRRAFPYTSETMAEEISSSPDPALDVGRVSDYVVTICQQLSSTGTDQVNLLRATLDFYLEVSPVLLEAGVPVVPFIRKDVLYQVLLGSDVLALNKVLLMFSRYRNLSARLMRIRGTPVISRMASASSQQLRAATGPIHDVLWLLYDRRKGDKPPFESHSTEVRAALDGVGENVFLPDHPAAITYQDADSVRPLLTLLASDGLVGFAAFWEQYK